MMMRKISVLWLGVAISGAAFADHVHYVCTGESRGSYQVSWDDRVGGTGQLIVIRNGQTLASLNPAGIVFANDPEDSDVLHLKGGNISNYFVDFAIHMNIPIPPQPDAYLGFYGGIDNAEADHLQLTCERMGLRI